MSSPLDSKSYLKPDGPLKKNAVFRIEFMAPKSHKNQAEVQHFTMVIPESDWLHYHPTDEIASALGSTPKTPLDIRYLGAVVPLSKAVFNVATLDAKGFASIDTKHQVPIILHNEGSCINVIYYRNGTDTEMTWYKQFLYDCTDLPTKTAGLMAVPPSIEPWTRTGQERFMCFGDVGEPSLMVIRMVVQRVVTTQGKPLSFYGGNREWAVNKMAIFTLASTWKSLQ